MSAKWVHAAGVMFLIAGMSGGAEKAAEPVSAKPKLGNVEKATLPCIVYDDSANKDKNRWFPSGWMGSIDFIEFDDDCGENPHDGSSCIQMRFSDPGKWGGIVWQNPPENWGDEDGGVDLTGAKQLVIWARGEKGGETITLRMGGVGKEKPYFDTATVSRENIRLSKSWKRYTLQVGGKNLSRIISGFAFSVDCKGPATTVYLDDIQYE